MFFIALCLCALLFSNYTLNDDVSYLHFVLMP
jgi:hypothetical protein